MHILGISQRLEQSLHIEFGTHFLWLFLLEDYLLTSQELWLPQSLLSWFSRPERLLILLLEFYKLRPALILETLKMTNLPSIPSSKCHLLSRFSLLWIGLQYLQIVVFCVLPRVYSHYPHSIFKWIKVAFSHYQVSSDFLGCLNEGVNDIMLFHSSMPLHILIFCFQCP